ncbi:anti-adapter protein iraM [Cronobacter muytjensii]|uniref:anti-adapter protein iraM n=1 Tax=Cronobacter muytjensii TaxID=413501 RepID=UPI002DBD9C0F|nr:anti-adapter protein iraM [Cronobacter muytjensii]MEB8640740.1 anti-adapter protein iraM [Cronobacter muytjensii]
MDWKIVDTLASPDTGTTFTLVETPYGLRYILWFKGDYFLRRGQILSTCNEGLRVDGRLRAISIIHAAPYSGRLWQNLAEKTNCPGNAGETTGACPGGKRCLFKLCPYGLREYPQESYYMEKNNYPQSGGFERLQAGDCGPGYQR